MQMIVDHVVTSPSYQCIKEPRCSFCYVEEKKVGYSKYNWIKAIKDLNPESVATEYSGYNILWIDSLAQTLNEDVEITITTMPEIINETFLKFLKNRVPQLEGISLSFNENTSENWKEKAVMIKKHDISLACNYLLGCGLKPPIDIQPMGDSQLIEYDQLNILSRKPPELPDKEDLKFLIMLMRYLSMSSKMILVEKC